MTEPRVYTLELPAGLELLNANEPIHWRVVHRRRKALRQAAWALARSAKIPRLERAHITGRLHFPDGRRRDGNNWADSAKPAVDGLVDAGVFDDDDSTRVLGPDMRIGEKRPKSQLVLEIRELAALDPARSL